MTAAEALEHLAGDYPREAKRISDEIFRLRNGLGQAEEDLRDLANIREILTQKANDAGEDLYLQDSLSWDEAEENAERGANRALEFLED